MENKQLLTFRRRNSVPSGGYAYLDPNKKFRIIGGTFDDLVRNVKAYRKGNGFEIESNLSDVIEDWICKLLPVDQTSAYEKNSSPVVTNATSATIVAITTKMLQAFKVNGRVKVSNELAKQRGEICRKCPHNVSSIACASCQGITQWIQTRVSGPKEYSDKLNICKPSAIMNMAQIYMPMEVIKQVMTPDQIQTHGSECWKVKELS